jgi:RNA polymerase subunit RPABC4/transcription elongation factor Spt4
MSSYNCHRCGRLMASSFLSCPHCGAPQDEQSRAESARKNREALLVIIPTILGTIAGRVVSESGWFIVGGGLVGLLIGIGIIAVLYVREHRK